MRQESQINWGDILKKLKLESKFALDKFVLYQQKYFLKNLFENEEILGLERN